MEQETLEVDVLIVGGGPAGLSAALRLTQIQKEREGEPISIAVLEKSREAGSHMLSGAVLDTSSLRDLIPDFKEKGAPLAAEVHKDHVYFLTKNLKIPFPVIPPPLQNHGNYVISLNKFVHWLSEQAEKEGVDIFSGFSGQEVILEGDRVCGVRTGDRGIDKDGKQKQSFEPGVDIKAKVTIFCDGVRGNLTKQLLHKLKLGKNSDPEQFAIGIKELWELKPGSLAPGTVIHTIGYPLKHEEFGGGFLYALPDNQASVGFVTGLDYKDPLFDPHVAFNNFKKHPSIANLLRGGQMLRYGAKALPEGGWNTIPQVHMDGGLIAGDAGGFLNSMRLKGIHLAMRTGMLAAEAAFEAISIKDTSASTLALYKEKINAGHVRSELYPVRNIHQAFGYGLLPGLIYSGLALLTKGWWIRDKIVSHAGHEQMKKVKDYYGRVNSAEDILPPSNVTTVDRALTFDKVTNVHYSGTSHEENQPSHLLVQTDVCPSVCGEEYGYPCIRFCPANVYEIVDDVKSGKQLQINASNCVHCKTCDIMDPYSVITWVPPEGGGGPQYNGM